MTTFYSPTDSRFTRNHLEEMQLAFSAMDCALIGERAIYASTELTSGFRVFEACRTAGVTTAAELKRKMGAEWHSKHIWDANVVLALRFAEAIRRTESGRPVITPAPFTARGWSQFEYLAFWEELIRTRIGASWFNENWEFSNGCTFEFAVAQDTRVPTFDKDGNAITLDSGIAMTRRAIQSVEAEGFEAAKLRENLDKMLQTQTESVRIG